MVLPIRNLKFWKVSLSPAMQSDRGESLISHALCEIIADDVLDRRFMSGQDAGKSSNKNSNSTVIDRPIEARISNIHQLLACS